MCLTVAIAGYFSVGVEVVLTREDLIRWGREQVHDGCCHEKGQ